MGGVARVLGAIVLVMLAAGIGAWLVLRRPDVPHEALEAKYATPTSHYVELGDGVRAHYRDDGAPEAPVVILVHGFGDSFRSWAQWIDVLKRDFRVVTVDLPGHGLTRAPPDFGPNSEKYSAFIIAFADRLGVGRFAIVGNSLGGNVAWLTAAAHPDRVDALVLLDAGGWPSETLRKPPLAFQLLQTPVGRYLLETIETRPITAASLRANFVDQSIVTPDFVDEWVEIQRGPGRRQILMSMSFSARGVASREALAPIRAPTLVQHGEADQLIEVAAARKFADAIAGAQLITYPDVGHLPQLEIPARSAEDAAAFLRAHMAAQAAR